MYLARVRLCARPAKTKPSPSISGTAHAYTYACASQCAEGLHFSAFDFTSTGAWDVGHIKNVLDNGRRKVNQLHSVISNRDINLSARRLFLLAVVVPTLVLRIPIAWQCR